PCIRMLDTGPMFSAARSFPDDSARFGGKDPSCVGTGFDGLCFDAQRLIDRRPGRYRRLNATYTQITPALPARAASR
uniref:hypothetical protein n=1 Tax=Candidatus Thiosymbion oneisti TaxID=589554 RepID=UPI001A9C6268